MPAKTSDCQLVDTLAIPSLSTVHYLPLSRPRLVPAGRTAREVAGRAVYGIRFKYLVYLLRLGHRRRYPV